MQPEKPSASIVVPAHNALPRLVEVLAAIVAQAAPARAEVIVVDDASTDATATVVRERFAEVRLVRMPTNAGRARARSSGVALAASDVLVFVDADCVPADGWLAAHLAAFAAGVTVSIGAVAAAGDGFWARYQRRVAERRARVAQADPVWAATSQNLAMTRASFVSCGGFDPAYAKYGFEDRDLVARLVEHGAKVAYSHDALVMHEPELRIADVARKMGEAGRHSAPLFAARHADAYARSPYGAIDCALHPALAPLASAAGPVASLLVRWFGPAIDATRLPFWFAALLVRGISALAYMAGCRARGR